MQSNGAAITVTGQPGHGPVQVTETLTYDTAGPAPAVTDTVTRGLLTLSAPACSGQQDNGGGPACSVGFSVTVPAGVTVTAAAAGGPVTRERHRRRRTSSRRAARCTSPVSAAR